MRHRGRVPAALVQACLSQSRLPVDPVASPHELCAGHFLCLEQPGCASSRVSYKIIQPGVKNPPCHGWTPNPWPGQLQHDTPGGGLRL